MVDQLSDYGYNKSADATSLNSASLTGFPAFVRLEEGTDSTGTGPGVLDSNASINGKEDIGFFNESGTQVDYTWITFDTSNGVYEAWVRTDITRDGGTELQVGYGSGNTDDSVAKTTVWGNVPGIYAAWDYTQTSAPAVDITGNGHDETSGSVTSRSASGPFGGAYEFRGGAEEIVYDQQSAYDLLASGSGRQATIISWYYVPSADLSNVDRLPLGYGRSTGSWALHPGNDADGDGTDFYPRFDYYGDNNTNSITESLLVDEFSYQAHTWDESTGDLLTIANNTDEGINTTSDRGGASQKLASGNSNNDGDAYGRLAMVQFYNTVKQKEWIQSQYDHSPKAGYTLFSWNASSKTDQTGTVKESSSSLSIKTSSTLSAKTNPV